MRTGLAQRLDHVGHAPALLGRRVTGGSDNERMARQSQPKPHSVDLDAARTDTVGAVGARPAPQATGVALSRPPVLDHDALPDFDQIARELGVSRIESSDTILPTLRFFAQVGCVDRAELDAAVADPAHAERALLDLVSDGETAFHVESARRIDAAVDFRTPVPWDVPSRIAYLSASVQIAIRSRLGELPWMAAERSGANDGSEPKAWGVVVPEPQLAEYASCDDEAVERLRVSAIDALGTFLYPAFPVTFLAQMNDDMIDGDGIRAVVDSVMGEGYSHPADCDTALEAFIERLQHLKDAEAPEGMVMMYDPSDQTFDRDGVRMQTEYARVYGRLNAMQGRAIQLDEDAGAVADELRAEADRLQDGATREVIRVLDWVRDVADAIEAMEQADPGGRAFERQTDQPLGESEMPAEMLIVSPSDPMMYEVVEEHMNRLGEMGDTCEYAIPAGDTASARRLQLRVDRLNCGQDLLKRLTGIGE